MFPQNKFKVSEVSTTHQYYIEYLFAQWLRTVSIEPVKKNLNLMSFVSITFCFTLADLRSFARQQNTKLGKKMFTDSDLFFGQDFLKNLSYRDHCEFRDTKNNVHNFRTTMFGKFQHKSEKKKCASNACDSKTSTHFFPRLKFLQKKN